MAETHYDRHAKYALTASTAALNCRCRLLDPVRPWAPIGTAKPCRSRPPPPPKKTARFQHFFSRIPRGGSLDVGCGEGRLSGNGPRRGWKVVGFDYDERKNRGSPPPWARSARLDWLTFCRLACRGRVRRCHPLRRARARARAPRAGAPGAGAFSRQAAILSSPWPKRAQTASLLGERSLISPASLHALDAESHERLS